MSRPLESRELLKLVADCELQSFAQSLGFSVSASNPREEIENKLCDLPRTRVISAVLQVNGIWLTMMKDVVRFLESNNVSLRTTGCILILPSRDEPTKSFLSPQVANVLATFDVSTMRPKVASDWEHALKAFERLENWIEGVQQSGEPVRYRRLNHNRVVRAAMGHAPIDLYDTRITVDSLALEQMFSLWRTLAYLNYKLVEILKSPRVQSHAAQLVSSLSTSASGLTERIERMQRDYDTWDEITRHVQRTDPWSASWTTDQLFREDCWRGEKDWDDWIRFIEDVLSLARLESSSEVADLLRLDLLKDRPRLFEVWCLCTVLEWYRSRKCTVDLESIKLGDPPVWNLNYSRSARPIARIQDKSNHWWVFYQLFQQGVDSANMPDIALLDGADPKSKAIWIADPKYSEAGAYTRADYTEVAERYRDTFHPQHVWICEFFARPNWFDGASMSQGHRFSILTEVQPKGEGIRLLERSLADLHGFETNEFVLAVDCSGSFANELQTLEESIRSLATRAAAIVCFADSATVINDSNPVDLTMLRSQSLPGGGTKLKPLVMALEQLQERDSSRTDLVLITDGQFSDHVDSLSAKLERMFAKVKQVGDKDSILEIMGNYGPT